MTLLRPLGLLRLLVLLLVAGVAFGAVALVPAPCADAQVMLADDDEDDDDDDEDDDEEEARRLLPPWVPRDLHGRPYPDWYGGNGYFPPGYDHLGRPIHGWGGYERSGRYWYGGYRGGAVVAAGAAAYDPYGPYGPWGAGPWGWGLPYGGTVLYGPYYGHRTVLYRSWYEPDAYYTNRAGVGAPTYLWSPFEFESRGTVLGNYLEAHPNFAFEWRRGMDGANSEIIYAGALEWSSGDFVAAGNLYREALIKAPRDSFARFAMAMALVGLHDWDYAERMLDEGLALNDMWEEMHQGQDVLNSNPGAFRAEVDALAQLHADAPTDRSAKLLTFSYIMLSDWESAEAAIGARDGGVWDRLRTAIESGRRWEAHAAAEARAADDDDGDDDDD